MKSRKTRERYRDRSTKAFCACSQVLRQLLSSVSFLELRLGLAYPLLATGCKRDACQCRPQSATRASGHEGSGALEVAAATQFPEEVTSRRASATAKKLLDWLAARNPASVVRSSARVLLEGRVGRGSAHLRGVSCCRCGLGVRIRSLVCEVCFQRTKGEGNLDSEGSETSCGSATWWLETVGKSL